MWHPRIRRTAVSERERGAVRRRPREGGRLATTGGVVLGLALTLAPAPGALAAPVPVPAGTYHPPTMPATADDRPSHTVTLVTGERVTLGADAGVVVAPRRGASAANYVTERLDNDVYVIPLTALPYLGTVLDPALFDVSALVRAGLTATPVRVEGGTAPAPGPAFGAALAHQTAAQAAAKRVGDGPLFGGVTSVRPAFTTAGTEAAGHREATADRSVRVTVLGPDGTPRPGATPFSLADVDDAGSYQNPALTATDGHAEVDVPAGHYSALVAVPDYDGAGDPADVRLATAEFTVPDDATGTDVVLDLSKATEQVTFATPKPSRQAQLILHYLRQDATGEPALNHGLGVTGDLPVYVQPSAGPVRVGNLHFNAYTHRDAPADATEPYSYDLKLDDPPGAIAPDQHHKVTAHRLTTVRTRYHSDRPDRAEEVARLMSLPYEQGSDALSEPFHAPMRRVEYVGGSPGATYQDWLKAGDLRFISTPQPLLPGRTIPVDWLRGPLVPGLTAPARGATVPHDTWYCQACRKGDTLAVVLHTTTDSDGHYALSVPSDVTATHMTVRSAGVTLYDQDDVVGAVVTVPPEPASYTVAYDQTRLNPAFHQSLTTHTEWSFSSAHSGDRTVPDDWSCVADDGQYGDSAACSALPLITPHYRLGAAPDGTSATGDDHLAVTFGRAPGTTTGAAVTQAKVEISYDGGSFWTKATTTPRGKDTFAARWTNPDTSAGKDVTLRITATDAAGDRLVQTVVNAFTVAGQTGV